MSDIRSCPLCGKKHNGEGDLCEDCQNHVDNQYAVDLFDRDESGLSPLSTNSSETDITQDKLEEEISNAVAEETPKEKKGLSKGVIFVLIGCLLLVVVGAVGSLKVIQNQKSVENEDTYWNSCVEENTPLAYSKYLLAFENGRYVDEASSRIQEFRNREKEAWEELQKSSDINDFYAYLSENPKTTNINRIRFLMDSLSWLQTIQDNTAESYAAYLENVKLGNVSGEHVDIAQDKYNYLSQIKPIDGQSLDSLKLYLVSVVKVLSENEPKALLKMFAPTVVYAHPDSSLTSTELVALLDKERTDKDVKEIAYTLKKQSVIAKQDSKGVIFADVVLDKQTTYQTKIKVGKKMEYKTEQQTDTFDLEFSPTKQIQLLLKK